MYSSYKSNGLTLTSAVLYGVGISLVLASPELEEYIPYVMQKGGGILLMAQSLGAIGRSYSRQIQGLEAKLQTKTTSR